MIYSSERMNLLEELIMNWERPPFRQTNREKVDHEPADPCCLMLLAGTPMAGVWFVEGLASRTTGRENQDSTSQCTRSGKDPGTRSDLPQYHVRTLPSAPHLKIPTIRHQLTAC